MKANKLENYTITALTVILGILATNPAKSQPITPSNDSTGTTVNQNGNQFNIQGGTHNGTNLFHSFDRFNLHSGQTANFFTTPDTRNILGRITGGDPSIINGLIQVIGGNSNLFLMNPAGIMFGPNASLNIPASFSVTTATGIGFNSNNFWFQVMGTNDYANLVGNPSGYHFNVSNPGAIVNEGNLSLNPGENLTLLGGTVINTGQLSTAGGNVTIAAVEGGSTLRISQPGHLLSLEVGSKIGNGEDFSSITPLSLPELLTGGEIIQATSMTVNGNGDVVLIDSNTIISDTVGDAIASGDIDVSASDNFGGKVNVLGDRVALIDTNINASGIDGGGRVLIGGDFQGNGIVPNSQQTFVNNNSFISADAINNGDGGQVIIWSDEITNFAGNISAKGGKFSGDGGFVEVSGKQQLIFDGNVNVSAAFGTSGTILLDPENITVGESENTESSETETVDNNLEVASDENTETTENVDNSEIEVTSTANTENSETTETETPIDPFAQDENSDVTISAENIGELSGDIILFADNDITINEKIETTQSVELKAGRSININADIDTSIGNGNIDLLGNNDEMNIANRSAGAASINQLDGTTLNAGSGTINIQLGNLGEVGDINLANLTTTGQILVNANGGNIARVSDSSIINAGSALFQTSGSGGIGLTNAPLQLNVENLEAISGSGGVFFDVGNVNIGGVSEDIIGISTGGGRGNINLESEGDVTVTEDISTDLYVDLDGETGGDINITAKNLFVIDGAWISASTFANGDAGSVNITVEDSLLFDGVSPDDPNIVFFGEFTDNLPNGAFSIVGRNAEGNAGGVSITTGSLEVKNYSVISADTFGKGDAGNVEINATDTIVLEGGDLGFATGVFSNVAPGAEGNAGGVTITTGSLEVKNNAAISANTWGKGDAGSVEINTTDTIVLDGGGNPETATGVSSDVAPGAEGNAGGVSITTESLEVKNTAAISANTWSKGDAGSVEINATESIVLDGGENPEAATRVGSDVLPGAEGNAGGVNITTGSLEVEYGGVISSSTGGKGDAGSVEINATESVVLDGGENPEALFGVTSYVLPGAEGNAGDITINTESLEVKNGGVVISSSTWGKGNGGNVEINATDTIVLDGGGLEFGGILIVGSDVLPGAEGNAGDVTITTGSLEVKNNAAISANTYGKGDGGSVEINATESVVFDGGNLGAIAGSSSEIAEGDAGGITILSLEIINGASISASIFGKGNSGSFEINATDTVAFDGRSLEFVTGAFSGVNIGAEGDAGGINITTGSLEVKRGALISASTDTFGKGNAGSVEINATDSVVIDGDGGNSEFFTGENVVIDEDGRNLEFFTGVLSAVNIGAEGDAGGITITTGSLEVINGAQISTSIFGQGNAGNIFITADTQLTLNQNTQISAFTESSGKGGNIIIFAPENLNISGNGQITVSSSGSGNAGQIDIISSNITLSDGIDITAFTTGPGNAGNINLEGDNIDIQPNTKILAFTENEGEGGNITVRAIETLNLGADSQLSVETNSSGKAGNIEISTPELTIGDNAQISATVNLGATSTEPGGNITINTNELNIAGELGIFAETEATADAGSLTLTPYKTNPDLDITFSNDGFISASTSSTGNGGNINILAPETIDIAGTGFIAVETSDKGNAGTINIETQNLTLSDGVVISASTTDKGNAGAIEIDTEEFTLETGTSLTTETNDKGKAGDIEINTRKLTIGEDAQISATATEGATNNEAGGNITINATDLLISGQLGIFAETAGETPAGTLTLKPYRKNPDLNITFTENGFISARTTSSGDGGNINILAPENINILGEGRITVETEGRGNAGIINIETENLTIAENTTISAATSDRGDGGSININPSESFQLEGQIITETTGAGDGGKITINTGELSADNSTISARSTDAGNAGAIEITAQENIVTGIIQSSASESKETADGGDITITSEQGEINATQPIQSFSEKGNAGDVTLSAKTDVTTNTISSHGEQQGGEITIITETGNIDTSNGFLANYSGEGTGGNVTLEASAGNITTSDIYSFADADGGQILLKAGGDINIAENSNIISASEPATTSDTENPGKGGDIILEAGGNINTTTARIYSGADVGDTGTIDIVADDAIEVGQIDLASGFVREERSVFNNFTLIPRPQEEATQGVAGNISITSNNGTIDTTAGVINSRSPDGTGDITLNARENITVGKLEASALNEAKPTTGGNVEIISEQGGVNSNQAIETFSEQGMAGNVNIQAESSVNLESILSQGRERGGDITIDSRSANSIDVQGQLNTFSTEGIGGNVTLTSLGNISISGIRSEGMEQGGDITLVSEIGEIMSTGDITSFSEEGRGGSIEIDAPESINLENVSSFGATESGDLRIKSQIATVNTGNVTTQAPDGPSGEVTINGSQITTGNLSSLGTVSSGIIQLEATDGSITTLDLESIATEGEAGGIDLDATGDISSEDQIVISEDGDANIDIDAGGDVSVGNQEAIANQGDANIDIQAGGDISAENQTAQANQGDANIDIQAGGDISVENQTAQANQGDANINVQAGGDISVEEQTAISEGGNATINNIPNNINTPEPIAIAPDNTNTPEPIAVAPDNTNTPEPIAIAPQEIETITNIDSGDAIISENTTDNQIVPVETNPTPAESLDNSTEIPITTSTETTATQTDSNQSQSILQQISGNSNFFTLTAPTNNNQTTNAGTAQEQTETSISTTTETQKILKTINTTNTKPLITATASDQVVTMLERNSIQEYSDFLGADLEEKLISTQSVREILSDMANQTGKESAVVYINVYPEQLQIILYTKEGSPIIKTIPSVNREQIMEVALELRIRVTTPANQDNDSYLSPAQKLYSWLIAPIASELEAANIDTILFSMDEGLRTLAVAALHDGEQFLIEKYSLSLIPSFSLMDTDYKPLQDTQVLAMGASEFIAHNSLPGVPVELEIVSQELWQGSMFLNEDFTLNNLITQKESYPYPIIHLATHADFRPGAISNSYIQLWGEEQIKLDQIRDLGWDESSVELLVLSACRTAFGDKDAELGFAGLAIASGVKSALASIWYVDDRATLALMTEFYSHLNQTKIKAEAVRQAQLAMLRGDVVIRENQIINVGGRGAAVLASVLGEMRSRKLSHPYHWAGFTMVGSPW